MRFVGLRQSMMECLLFWIDHSTKVKTHKGKDSWDAVKPIQYQCQSNAVKSAIILWFIQLWLTTAVPAENLVPAPKLQLSKAIWGVSLVVWRCFCRLENLQWRYDISVNLFNSWSRNLCFSGQCQLFSVKANYFQIKMAADHQDQLITLLRENEGFPSVQPTHHPSVQLESDGSR